MHFAYFHFFCLQLEKLPIKEDVILRLQAKVEDLQAMVAEKQNYQR